MAEVVWLASYPKSGNTWTRALLAGYFGDGAFDLNNLGANVALGGLRSLGDLLGVDSHLLQPNELLDYRPEAARQLAREVADRDIPAVHKLHSANYQTGQGEYIFPAGAGRTLYVVRNPLDVVTSWAPFFGVTLDDAIDQLGDESFVLNKKRRGFQTILPEPLLSWSGHVRSWLDAPGVPVHILRYEDLQADAPAAFTAALQFLGYTLDLERVTASVDAARFDRLQAKEVEDRFREHTRMATAPFFRKGQAGGWREELTPEQAIRVVTAHREVMLRLGYEDHVAEVEDMADGT